MKLAFLTVLAALLVPAVCCLADPQPPATPPEINANTYSIVAHDPEKGEWGVGVASRVLAVGAVVPWAQAGVGAVATQSSTNVSYGPRGLELMKAGKTAEEAIRIVTDDDKRKEVRQVGMIDAKGNAHSFTGAQCGKYAGGRTGKNYACQGNLLAGEAVVEGMAKAFEGTKGPLAWRILAAMEAAEKAGGDRRGKQSASILVVRDRGGSGGGNDRYIDLRVDDHKEPVEELARLLSMRIKRPRQ